MNESNRCVVKCNVRQDFVRESYYQRISCECTVVLREGARSAGGGAQAIFNICDRRLVH